MAPMIHHKPSSTIARAALVALAAALVVACGAASPSGTPIPVAPTGAATAAATTAAATAGVPTSVPATAAATSSGTGTATVDLTFAGTRVFTANGTKGTCKVLNVDGAPHFGFEATSADYPALGVSFSLAELNTDHVDIKWVIDSNIAYGNDPSSPIKLSPDHHMVTIDQDLSPFSSGGGNLPGPQHVKGTIACS